MLVKLVGVDIYLFCYSLFNDDSSSRAYAIWRQNEGCLRIMKWRHTQKRCLSNYLKRLW